MTQHPDLFAALAAPFSEREVKILQKGGRNLSYITARTVMNKLDDVLGPENWEDSYTETRDGLKCTITVTLPDGRKVSKSDGGGSAGMADGDDDEKSAFSSAFKRAAVKFGIGRYLYRDGVPQFARERYGDSAPAEPRQSAPARQEPARDHAPQNGYDRQEPPRQAEPRREPAQNGYSQGGQGGGNGRGNPPRSGKGLFAWLKDMEQRYEVGLLKYISQWAKLQEFPARMVDFDAEQVELAYKEASRKLDTLDQGQDEPREEALSN